MSTTTYRSIDLIDSLLHLNWPSRDSSGDHTIDLPKTKSKQKHSAKKKTVWTEKDNTYAVLKYTLLVDKTDSSIAVLCGYILAIICGFSIVLFHKRVELIVLSSRTIMIGEGMKRFQRRIRHCLHAIDTFVCVGASPFLRHAPEG